VKVDRHPYPDVVKLCLFIIRIDPNVAWADRKERLTRLDSVTRVDLPVLDVAGDLGADLGPTEPEPGIVELLLSEGNRPSALSVCSPFARKGVCKRHALRGEAAHMPSTSSIDRAKHASLVHSTLTRPTPPPQGGEIKGLAPGIWPTNSEGIHEWCNPNFAPRQGVAPREPRHYPARTEPPFPGITKCI
jgi:hypothetical protein